MVNPSSPRLRKHRKYPRGALGLARRLAALLELC